MACPIADAYKICAFVSENQPSTTGESRISLSNSLSIAFELNPLAIRVQAGIGTNIVVERELAPKPVPTSSQYFNIINLFSYDQPLALQANAVPGGAENAQDSFIQFYLNDQGNGRNGGCQLTWDPQENQGPPINMTQKLEFDGFKTATLRSYQPPGEFVVDIRHE
ncbi:MAG: hypothetical protein HETSPECPRED_009364 [Heterodermia speciosa]|uniref:Uncharacterized protein n=1 Tax=Heterodermia speciosa TaxID=116794 RepID=A0A8H3IVY2_9LECA|nr:MAG: hypothetical protein HETSPECPRED_009364 [Heterodermia speciosa]